MVRLLKPVAYYEEKYGTALYGLNKLYLLMEKQHNRGQEGAGLVCVNIDNLPGEEYMFRERATGVNAIKEIFSTVHHKISEHRESGTEGLPLFAGQLYMGHLRYSTTGKSGLSYIHPFLRRNNWRAKSLCICANFNMTNVDEIFSHIAVKGQHPRMISDTYLLLEQLGHRLDRESERNFNDALALGLHDTEITDYIEDHIDVANILEQSATVWDGGYVVCGVTGSGEMFCMRDPWGIRPAFWMINDEVFALASERPVLQTTFNTEADNIVELKPGETIIINKKGEMRLRQIIAPKKLAACSFERVYFSRGSDIDIYNERKELGRSLVPSILKAIDHDIDNTVFAYIPNTAEVAFYGMVQGLNEFLNDWKAREIERCQDHLSSEEIGTILSRRIRTEKVAIKDIKLRTFISEGASRNDLAAHVYDITYGSLRAGIDNLVVIDDSIVRGTTLRESIIRILDRLHPKRIVVVSSSPQVRYPDYYGIDMQRMDEFIAFKAAVELASQRGFESIIKEICLQCKSALDSSDIPSENYVKRLYDLFTDEEISDKIVEMLKPEDVGAEVKIVYQTLEGLHRSCPESPGDWYFSGNYPTPGGLRQLYKAFIAYCE